MKFAGYVNARKNRSDLASGRFLCEHSVEQTLSGLAGVVFDHAHGFDGERDRVDGGKADELDLELFLVDLEICRSVGGDGLRDLGDLRGLFGVDGDDLADLHDVGGTVDDLAVNEDMTMADELLGRENGGRETGMVDDAVEAGFDALHHDLVGLAFDALGIEVGGAELAFGERVVSSEFLLFEHHFAVCREFLAVRVLALETGGVGTGAALHGGAVRHVPDAVADAAAEFVFRLTLFHPLYPF